MMRQPTWVLSFMSVILLGLSGAPSLAQGPTTTPDDFDITFRNLQRISRVVRHNGEDHVTVTFTQEGFPDQVLTRDADKPDSIGLCRARMEAFQTVLPEGAANDFVKGVPNLDGFIAVFLQPTILVGRSLQGDTPATATGGEWTINRTINAIGWTLLSKPGPPCIYPDNPNDQPTIGPWEDLPSDESVVNFPYNERVPRVEIGHAIVSVDAPSVGGPSLETGLGKLPAPPQRPVVPGKGDNLKYTTHLRTFFWLDCHQPNGELTLFFRVDWGFDIEMKGFTHDEKDALGKLTSVGVGVMTRPPPYPQAAILNGPIAVAFQHPMTWTRWTLTQCQAEPQ